MAKKKRALRGMKSLLKQIKEHSEKLKEARSKEDSGFERYTIKEIRTFGKEAMKRKLKASPRRKRIRLKKRLKK